MNGYNFELEDSIIDFLPYYNNRVHRTTKFFQYEIMEKRSEKLTMDKARKKTLNSRKTNKIEEFKQGQVVFVSNKSVQPNKEMKYLNYYKPTISKKGEQKVYFIVKAKIIDENRNYCKVEIISKQDKNHILQFKEIWKIWKEALKLLIIYNINKNFIVFIFEKKELGGNFYFWRKKTASSQGLEFRRNTYFF